MTQQTTYPTDRPLTGDEMYAIVKGAVDAGDLTRAEDHFRRVLDAEPANALALASLANQAARRADWDPARRLAEQALAAEPRQRLALTTLANVAVATGSFADAGTIIDSALAD